MPRSVLRTIGLIALSTACVHGEISPEEAKQVLAEGPSGGNTPANKPGPVAPPLFTPKESRPESLSANRPDQEVSAGRGRPDGFFELTAGYVMAGGAVSASGARSDLGGAFAHDMGGVNFAGGRDFGGYGRAGLSGGYYADHVPWGLALAGEVVIGTAAVLNGQSPAGLPSPYYRLRTELSAIPLSLFYEQTLNLGDAGEFHFGPLVGGTIHIASADYAQGDHTAADVGFHFGARAGFDFHLSRTLRLRLGYEYRRMEATDYDLGFALHMAARHTHTVQLGVTALF